MSGSLQKQVSANAFPTLSPETPKNGVMEDYSCRQTPVTKVGNKVSPYLINNLSPICDSLGISFRELTCYRAIENQNVLMMFLVAAR
jgi:hypothetical protein